MEKSNLLVFPNGDLKLKQANNWFVPIEGLNTISNGCFDNPNWIYANDINFSIVKNWDKNYKPFQYCKLILKSSK